MRVLLLVACFGLAMPVHAAPNAQLVQSVQHRLNAFGFQNVEASTLSTSQIAALHLKLTNNATRFGLNGIRLRQEIKSILTWEK